MKHKIIISITMVLTLCGTVSAQERVRMSLDSCLRYAYSHNITLQNAQLNRESAEAALSGAKMNFLPALNASASQGWAWNEGRSHSTSYGLNGSLTLFDGLSYVRNYQQAKLSQQQSDLTARQSQNTVAAKIISAYLTIVMNEEKLSYQQEVLETTRQQQSEGELKFRVGKILESDYRLLEANYLSAQAEIENTRLTIDNNRRELRDLMCMPAGQTVEVAMASNDSVDADAIPTYNELLQASKESMPDWELGRLEVEKARCNVELARASFLPSLSLNAGMSYNNGEQNLNGTTLAIDGGLNKSVSLGLNIPLFDRGSTVTKFRQSKLSLRQAELNYQQDTIDIEATLHKQYNETLQALNSFRKTKTMSEAYHASYDVYKLKYKEGAITTVEMLQQQDKYLSALNEYLMSKYTFILAQKQLEIYMGKLKVEN